jgi:hypothetical protein
MLGDDFEKYPLEDGRLTSRVLGDEPGKCEGDEYGMRGSSWFFLFTMVIVLMVDETFFR